MVKQKESITNRTALKRFILEQVKVVRPGWDCTQVSSKALDQIEGFLRSKVKESLHRQPSIGKTYKDFY
jgi:hypothetical protein